MGQDKFHYQHDFNLLSKCGDTCEKRYLKAQIHIRNQHPEPINYTIFLMSHCKNSVIHRYLIMHHVMPLPHPSKRVRQTQSEKESRSCHCGFSEDDTKQKEVKCKRVNCFDGTNLFNLSERNQFMEERCDSKEDRYRQAPKCFHKVTVADRSVYKCHTICKLFKQDWRIQRNIVGLRQITMILFKTIRLQVMQVLFYFSLCND